MRTIFAFLLLFVIASADMPDEAGPHAAELTTLKVKTLKTGYMN